MLGLTLQSFSVLLKNLHYFYLILINKFLLKTNQNLKYFAYNFCIGETWELFPNKRKYIGIGICIGQNEMKNIGISAKIQYRASLVLSVGYFPDIWNQGLITLIFKNGDKFDPNNYRGICVSSNLGKLLCSIINARLLDFIITHNVLSRSRLHILHYIHYIF